MHPIKINRALNAAAIGSCPGSASDMLAAIPDSVVAALPGRLLAELLDANWQLAQRSKSLAAREALDEGAVWDDRRERMIELAADGRANRE
ncbi:hypothetical protein [Stakelama tenebrarum]|uniref:Uncharacterized protein n=1 Tax=Stakelama tenebrarum TaxID=2711215 RepID=A0A6G6Y5X0_9SPHN|nr:hypothetical protein [Sphingosinithalassobacter tenebrarum]QIG79976.1 hypothetical protein G5C33_09440 [Sphingosinithalassobacter tenebrarum]